MLNEAAPLPCEEVRIPVGEDKACSLYARRWRIQTGDETGDKTHQKAPIVLLHDSLGCVALWRDFPERLARASGRNVIAYDRLGFGQSSARTDTLPLSFVFDEAREGFAHVVRQFALDRFVVMGHSVGGGMALAIAGACPDQCCALITESAQAFVDARITAGIRAASRDFAATEQMQRLEKYHGNKAQWVLDAWVKTWLSPAFSPWNLSAHIPLVRCPVLAIHGEDDEYGSTAHPQKIAALALAPVTLCCIAACGHVPHREHSVLVLDAIAHFLEDIA